MTTVVLTFLGSALVVVIAGSFLSRFADEIAEITRLGRLVVGSILLAGATSLPELSVDVSAARMRMPDLAVGDLMGSSLMNLLVLGFLDLLPMSRGRMLSRLSVAHALPAVLSIALTAMASIAIATRLPLGVFDIGVGSLALIVAYVYGVRLVYLDQRLGQPLPLESAEQAGEHGRWALARAGSGFGLCSLIIILAAPRLAESAGELADLTGLGKTFVGSTLVALSTSLPELASSIAALRMGAPDLALGNVFGSNVFNMALLFPVDLAYSGRLLASVSTTHAVTGLAVIVVTSIVVMGQLYQSERRVRLIEPDGLVVVCLILASLALVYHLR